jgi:large subunit ribosomal protein L14
MIQVGSKLNVSDNSGAKRVQCIKILGKHSKSPGFLGDFIVVSVKQLRSKGNVKVKKKEVCLGLVFRMKFKKLRLDGRMFNFFDNTVILFSRSFKLYGTRFFGPIAKELRKQKKFKILSLGSNYF